MPLEKERRAIARASWASAAIGNASEGCSFGDSSRQVQRHLHVGTGQVQFYGLQSLPMLSNHMEQVGHQ